MLSKTCVLETERLRVKEWHSLSLDNGDLILVVANLLTEPVTRSLPTSWRGSYTVERARAWIRERDSEGATLLIVEKSTDQAIGLMILFETEANSASDGIEVRVGYLFSESAWGKGYASELISNFVAWCREQTTIYSIAGGVERAHPASRRVLEKNGFQLVDDDIEVGGDELLFRLNLRP